MRELLLRGVNSSVTVSNSNVIGGENNTVKISEDTRNNIEEVLQLIESSIEIFSESQD